MLLYLILARFSGMRTELIKRAVIWLQIGMHYIQIRLAKNIPCLIGLAIYTLLRLMVNKPNDHYNKSAAIFKEKTGISAGSECKEVL